MLFRANKAHQLDHLCMRGIVPFLYVLDKIDAGICIMKPICGSFHTVKQIFSSIVGCVPVSGGNRSPFVTRTSQNQVWQSESMMIPVYQKHPNLRVLTIDYIPVKKMCRFSVDLFCILRKVLISCKDDISVMTRTCQYCAADIMTADVRAKASVGHQQTWSQLVCKVYSFVNQGRI